MLQTQLHRVPLSRCWTPEDWVVHRWRQTIRQDATAAAAADGRSPATVSISAASASALAEQQQLLQAIGGAFGRWAWERGGGAALGWACGEGAAQEKRALPFVAALLPQQQHCSWELTAPCVLRYLADPSLLYCVP